MKKFRSIILLACFSASCFLQAKAQINYTDINPDDTINTTGGIYHLDLNNDGIPDFHISSSLVMHCLGCPNCLQCHINYIKVTISPADTNAVATDSVLPLAMPANNTVSSTLNWNVSPAQVLSINIPVSGNWNGQVNKYLGLKITKNGLQYYGWLRMSDSTNFTTSRFILKDYAYNTISNQPILAGQMSCNLPTVNLGQSGSLSFCAGDSVTFTANGTGYKYQWKKNNVNIAGATSKTYAAKTAGVYKCKVTNSCGSKTSGTRTVTVLCRNSNENISETLEQLSIFPNPASNSVTIKFPSDEGGEISIVNLFGQVIYEQNLRGFQNLEGLNEIKIDVNRFPEGIYVVRWNSGEYIESKIFSVVK